MLTPSGSWSTQQLTEFLAAVSSCPDEAAAVRAAVERAAEALESEVGAVVRAGGLVTAIGFGSDRVPATDLLAASQEASGALDLEGLGRCETAVALIEGSPPGRLLVARSGEGFTPEERNLLRGMGRVLALTLRQFHALAEERRLRAELEERQKLLEQLSRLQRAIANRVPLREVLDAVTAGAADLLDAEVVGLRVLDADDPRQLLLMSSSGLRPELVKRLWRTPAGSGVSGRAIAEEALVCADGPQDAAGALGELGERPPQAAMAAPVRESGRVVGSLLVASYQQGRAYSAAERSALVSFADQVSLALTDTRAVASLHQAFHLQRAVEQEEFTLVYQPIVSLEHGGVRGVEALLRWAHPTRGLVGPLHFVPLAEENGLIVPIGRWALQAACRQAVRWQREYPADPPRTMSVNLSARQLQQSGLVPEVASALEASGLDPNCLVLEITESVVVQDVDATITKLRALKQLGVRIAIDDFGTGYSSLSYLRQLPVDILKIDKSFVDGIADDREAAALARAIVGMGRTLNLRVVAEGIEKPDQLDELRRMRCELGQGYLFAKPLDAAAVARLLCRGAVAAGAPLSAS
jgi:EAL domain-containing protein (putative c-di-GMP-specific phosphodiesterase class I)/GAF domain-containing protein